MASSLATVVVILYLLGASDSLPDTKRNGFFGGMFQMISGSELDGVNGGGTCAACSILVGLTEQLTQIYNATVAEALEMLCGFLPGGFRVACDALVEEYAPGIIDRLEAKDTPDLVCYGIELCKKESEEMCHLFPLPKHYHKPEVHTAAIKHSILRSRIARGREFNLPDFCNLPLVDEICKIIDRFGGDHLPVDDVDGDYFSDLPTFRGSSWRGKDCNDFDPKIHPGLYTDGDALEDTNCNGIFGIEPSSGQTYESLWCKGTGQMGMVLLGDSVGAHFHIPPQWLISRDLSVDLFKDLFFILENEFDWPMLSATTAYKNSTWPDISGPANSSYYILRNINRCNHRDYQNLGVNGARSSAMAQTIVKSLARNATIDNPALVILELLGNDVCNSHHDIEHMTTPEEFVANNLKTLDFLETKLPSGSFVLTFGLGQGTVLYDSLHNRTHPIGSLRNDVTYSDFYDYLNCLYLSPCFGWMNTNETWRNITQERADALGEAWKEAVSKAKYKNFQVRYMKAPFDEVFDEWTKRGGEKWQLIEPVDGFHPNQIANALTAEVTWGLLEKNFPELLPAVNPNNEKIIKKFGDQGGYN